MKCLWESDGSWKHSLLHSRYSVIVLSLLSRSTSSVHCFQRASLVHILVGESWREWTFALLSYHPHPPLPYDFKPRSASICVGIRVMEFEWWSCDVSIYEIGLRWFHNNEIPERARGKTDFRGQFFSSSCSEKNKKRRLRRMRKLKNSAALGVFPCKKETRCS